MPRLDLKGISLNDITKKRVRRDLHVAPKITIRTEQVRRFPFKQLLFCVCLIVLTMVLIAYVFKDTGTLKPNFNKGTLRRMIRMKCQTRRDITYCTTSHGGGDYVVSVNGCSDIYEFNNIPFTDVFKDEFGNYRVPGSADSTLRIKDACKDIAATVDTVKRSYDTYAMSQSSGMGIINKVVWITNNCYKDFTVKINNQIIFEKTPISMIKSVKLENKSAYIYEPGVDYLEGNINIQGTGCSSPIIIYTSRS